MPLRTVFVNPITFTLLNEINNKYLNYLITGHCKHTIVHKTHAKLLAIPAIKCLATYIAMCKLFQSEEGMIYSIVTVLHTFILCHYTGGAFGESSN